MAGLPIGSIAVWYLNDTIPDDWQLCDGTNGTPDLRGSFPMGASIDGDLGASGGVNTHGHSASSVNTGGTHGHSNTSMSSGGGGTYNYAVVGSGDSCASSGHTHGYSVNITDDSTGHSDHSLSAPADGNNLPLHIKLYYIMKMV